MFGSIDHANSITLEQRVKEGHLIGDPSRLPVAWQKPSVEFTSAQWAVSPSSCEGQRRCLLRRKNMLSMQYRTVVINNWCHNSTLHEFQTNLCDETYKTDLLSRYDAELVTRSKCNVYNMVLAKTKINLKGSNQVTVNWKKPPEFEGHYVASCASVEPRIRHHTSVSLKDIAFSWAALGFPQNN